MVPLVVLANLVKLLQVIQELVALVVQMARLEHSAKAAAGALGNMSSSLYLLQLQHHTLSEQQAVAVRVARAPLETLALQGGSLLRSIIGEINSNCAVCAYLDNECICAVW